MMYDVTVRFSDMRHHELLWCLLIFVSLYKAFNYSVSIDMRWTVFVCDDHMWLVKHGTEWSGIYMRWHNAHLSWRLFCRFFVELLLCGPIVVDKWLPWGPFAAGLWLRNRHNHFDGMLSDLVAITGFARLAVMATPISLRSVHWPYSTSLNIGCAQAPCMLTCGVDLTCIKWK